MCRSALWNVIQLTLRQPNGPKNSLPITCEDSYRPGFIVAMEQLDKEVLRLAVSGLEKVRTVSCGLSSTRLLW
jgi:hypothetical protein